MTRILLNERLSAAEATAAVALMEAMGDDLFEEVTPEPKLGDRRSDPKRSREARQQSIQRRAARAAKRSV